MADAIDKNYFVKPGESMDDYNVRVATYNQTKTPAPTATPTPSNPTPSPVQGAQTPEQIAAAAAAGGMQPAPQSLPTPTPLPSAPASKPYTVQQGDTLASIATKFGVPIQSISGYRSGDPNKIFPGETISVGSMQAPGGGGQATPTATPTTPADDDLSKSYMDALMESMIGGSGEGMSDVPENLAQYGFTSDSLTKGFSTNPTKTVTDLVAEVMRATQLPDARSAIDDLAKQIEEVSNERDDKLQEIDDNPFLSGASKEQRKQELNDKYELRIKNRQTRLQLIQDAYDSAKQEAQFAASTAINLYDRNRSFDQGRFEFAVTQAEKRLESIRKMQEINPAEFKELRGGLFNIKTGEWVVQPTSTSDGGGGFDFGGNDPDVKDMRLNLMASNLRSLVAKTGPAAAIFDRAYQNAASQGPEAAEAYLRSQYINNVLSGTEREGFNNINNGIANYEAAIAFLEENPDLQTGFYKATVEGIKPKLFAGKDPRYATLINLINNAETPIRKATYGTALTPQEFSISTRSLLNTDDGRDIILQKLRENIGIYKNGLERNMASALGVPHQDQPVVQSTTQQTNQNNVFKAPSGNTYVLPY